MSLDKVREYWDPGQNLNASHDPLVVFREYMESCGLKKFNEELQCYERENPLNIETNLYDYCEDMSDCLDYLKHNFLTLGEFEDAIEELKEIEENEKDSEEAGT